MKKAVEPRGKYKPIILIIIVVLLIVFVLIPLFFSAFDGANAGNVALIPLQGVITADGGSYLGQGTVSSQGIVEFIKQADDNPAVKVIELEINSPGGSAVASDEIASAVKKSKKPVVSLIREVGASGGYWIASSTSHIIANRMSITGSIGVISSYLEFSGLMEKYGIGYEQLIAGQNKDMGTPYQKLNEAQRKILQGKLDTIHDFFIQEVAENRKLAPAQVRPLATGEFYLGVEALQLGLIDQLGDQDTMDQYLKTTYQLQKIEYVKYERQAGLFDILHNLLSQFSFSLGQGISSLFVQKDSSIMLR